MANFQIWVCLAIIALIFLRAFGDDVVVLTEENFEKEVGQDRGALIKFYTPWCGPCKKLGPEYEKLSASFKEAKSVLIGKVDCDEHKGVCIKYGVNVYPTTSSGFLMVSWNPKSALTAEPLTEFVNAEGGTHVKLVTVHSNVVVLTEDNFYKVVLDEKNDVLVMFYVPWCSHSKNLASTYEEVIASVYKLEEDVVIANLDADKYKDLAEKHGVRGYPTLKYFPKRNKDGEDYVRGHDLDDFVTFINEKRVLSRYVIGDQPTSKTGIVESPDTFTKKISQISKLAGRLDSCAARFFKSASNKLSNGAKKTSHFAEKVINHARLVF